MLAGGISRVENPGANFRDVFSGTSTNLNSLSNALLKIRFAYAGYEVRYLPFTITNLSDVQTECIQRSERGSSM